MKLKFRNFRRLKNSGPLYEGLDSILVLLFVMILCVVLAFSIGVEGSPVYFLFLPALACAYALYIELKGIFAKQNETNDK
jgi:threonine/homoserine/homoserine lactone efflux protein